jgi:hypothetical protein
MMGRASLEFAGVCLLLGVVVFAVDQAAAESNLTNLRDVVRLLGDEAEAATEDQWNWPRENPSIADETDFQVDQRQLQRLLHRRLDRNGAIDGYIKWQLLSFKPDFTAMNDREYEQTLRNWPQVLPTPQLDRRMQSALESLDGAMDPPDRLIEQVEQALAEREQAQELIHRANTPAVKYINAVVDAAPQRDGWPFLASVYQFVHLAEAGHKQARALGRRIDKRAEELSRDRSLPAAARRDAIRLLQRMGPTRIPGELSIVRMMSGETNINRRAVLDFSKKDLQTITNYLMGKGDE